MRNVDILIIGGGSAGLACAISAFNNGIESKNILIVEKTNYLGGILNQCIHTGFGLTEFKEELTGPEYAERFIKQLEEIKVPYLLNATVTNLSEDNIARISYKGNVEEVKFKALILCSGCNERSAGAIKLNGARVSGVLSAGQAQSYLNNYGYLAGKKVFILGSGDIGLIMARRMTLEGAKVLGVAELMPYSNGLKRNIVQCLEDYNIPLYLSTTVSKVIGKNHVEAIELTQVDDHLQPIKGTERIVECDTLLLSVGLVPNIVLFEYLKFDRLPNGKIMVNEKCETSKPGFFMSGNSLHVHDLVDYVTKESRTAGFYAAEFVKNGCKQTENLPVKFNNNISYCLPNIISKDATNFMVKFRVKKPVKDVTIVISDASKVIKKMRSLAIVPSEMQIIELKLNEKIDGFLNVEVIPNE